MCANGAISSDVVTDDFQKEWLFFLRAFSNPEQFGGAS
jgi:hypothetical protein